VELAVEWTWTGRGLAVAVTKKPASGRRSAAGGVRPSVRNLVAYSEDEALNAGRHRERRDLAARRCMQHAAGEKRRRRRRRETDGQGGTTIIAFKENVL
jgi:hypothetical protein